MFKKTLSAPMMLLLAVTLLFPAAQPFTACEDRNALVVDIPTVVVPEFLGQMRAADS
jgi:hypothetical protein